MAKVNDVVWNSPAPDSSGSMPLGNGDMALNAWVEPRKLGDRFVSRFSTSSGHARMGQLLGTQLHNALA